MNMTKYNCVDGIMLTSIFIAAFSSLIYFLGASAKGLIINILSFILIIIIASISALFCQQRKQIKIEQTIKTTPTNTPTNLGTSDKNKPAKRDPIPKKKKGNGL